MLETVKLLLGITDNSKDALLTLLVERAIQDAINITHNNQIVSICEPTILAMVVWSFNLLGTEGIEAETYSNVKFEYSADYPESLLRTLKANRKVMTI